MLSEKVPQKIDSKMSDFEILNKLSEGRFGAVYKVRRNADKKIYAIRQLKNY